MKVLILDGYNLIYKAKSGFKGAEHAVTFNFFRSLKPLIAKHKPDLCYFVLEGYPKHRFKIQPEYKAGRPKQNDNFLNQKRQIIDMLKMFPVLIAKHSDYECDDVAYSIALEHDALDHDVTIISGDSDFIQILQESNVKLWNPIKKAYVKPPEYHYLTWKAYRGDATDNIKGIPRVGDKTAQKMCRDLEMRDKILSEADNRNIYTANLDMIKLKKLEMETLEVTKGSWKPEKILECFESFEFSSMIKEKYWKDFRCTFETMCL